MEHEVSIISGIQAFAALDRAKYEPGLSTSPRTTVSTPARIWERSSGVQKHGRLPAGGAAGAAGSRRGGGWRWCAIL